MDEAIKNPLGVSTYLVQTGKSDEARKMLAFTMENIMASMPETNIYRMGFDLPSFIHDSRKTVLEKTVNEIVAPELYLAIPLLIKQCIESPGGISNPIAKLIKATRGSKVLQSDVDNALVSCFPQLLKAVADASALHDLTNLMKATRGTTLEKSLDDALVPVLPLAFIKGTKDRLPSISSIAGLLKEVRDTHLEAVVHNALKPSLSAAFTSAATPYARENHSLAQIGNLLKVTRNTPLEQAVAGALVPIIPSLVNDTVADRQGLEDIGELIKGTRGTSLKKDVKQAVLQALPAIFKIYALPYEQKTYRQKLLHLTKSLLPALDKDKVSHQALVGALQPVLTTLLHHATDHRENGGHHESKTSSTALMKLMLTDAGLVNTFDKAIKSDSDLAFKLKNNLYSGPLHNLVDTLSRNNHFTARMKPEMLEV